MATKTASDLSGQNLELARREVLDVAIPNTVAVSDVIDCAGGWIGFLHLGAAIDGADIRFLVTEDGSAPAPVWEPLVDDAGVEVKITVTVAVWIALPASIRDLLRLARWVQLETETAGSPTVQTADRSLKVGIVYK